jgi:hypothetical protein
MHLGYPKTGTTALQRHVLPLMADDRTAYLGLSPSGARFTDNRYLRWRREMTGRRPGWFLPTCRFEEVLRSSHLLGAWQDTLIVSEELLTYQSMHEAMMGRASGPGSLERVLARVHRSLPADAEIEVLLTIRRQEDLLPSFIAQDAHLMRSARRRTLRHAIRQLETRASELRELLAYDRTSTRIAEALGARVTLLPVELMATNPDGFVSRLQELVGHERRTRITIPVTYSRRSTQQAWTTSYGPVSSRIYRASVGFPFLPPERMKRRIPFDDTPLPRRPAPVVERTEEQRLTIRRIFSTSNTRLEERHGLGLRHLGYPLAA